MNRWDAFTMEERIAISHAVDRTAYGLPNSPWHDIWVGIWQDLSDYERGNTLRLREKQDE